MLVGRMFYSKCGLTEFIIQHVAWQRVYQHDLPSRKWPPFLCLNKQKQLQNLEDACDDIMMLDDGDSLLIPYQIGDVFISHSQEETQEMLEEAKVCLGKRELPYCGVMSIGMGQSVQPLTLLPSKVHVWFMIWGDVHAQSPGWGVRI